jgi:hypothetical protein
MNQNAWIDPRITQVKVEGARSYLTQHGWTRQPYPRPEVEVFAGPLDDDGKPILVLLPASEGLADYRLRIEDLIGTLAFVEDRYAGFVLNDILQAGSASPPSPNGAASSATPSPTAGR